MKKIEYITEDSRQTQRIAEGLAKGLQKDKEGFTSAQLFCLWGDLGAGKTTFSQGFAKGLDVKGLISSPTFIIMKEYILSGKWKGFNFFHFDAYRVKDAEEILALGWQDILSNKKNIVFVEWPERIIEILPSHRTDVRFTIVGNEKRNLLIDKH